jgi:NAD(P)-dependent dehydrogenase (short-subunit alcohol dehydrogenase family)
VSEPKVILITGASSGIGHACARHLSGHGYRVYGTSRRGPDPGTWQERSVAPPDGVRMMAMDVTSETSIERGIDSICEAEGRLDVVVNNAGWGLAGAVEDTTLAEAQQQFDVTFFGVLRICRAVLPLFREQRSGTIVNISSIGGLIGMPFQALYSASKFAVEGLSESLRAEVRPYGIRVVLIEPGDFCTDFTSRRQEVALAAASDYRERFRRCLSVMEHDETHGPSPDKVARLLERIIAHPSPRFRYAVGTALDRIAIPGKKLAPYGLFEWVVLKYYRLV